MAVDMTVWLPCDPRYVATARLIARESVKEAGAAGGVRQHPVRAADEDRGLMEIAWSAREDRAMDHVTDRVRRHGAVAHDLVRARVEPDDAVEDARMRRAIQLKKQLLHVGKRGGRAGARPGRVPE